MWDGVTNSKKRQIFFLIHVGIQYPEQISQEERMYIISSQNLR
jgi:hypothetical protein